MQVDILTVAVGGLATILGALIAGYFHGQAAKTSAMPNLLDSLVKRVEQLEKTSADQTKQIEMQSQEIQHWRNAYTKLLTWLKNLFSAHDIKEEIPEFHKK